MKTLWFVGLVVILLPAVVFFAGQFGMLKGKAPGDLGVHNGRLKPPSNTPNSVSSQAGLYPEHPQRGYADIPPLHYQGDGASALRKLADIVRALPATTVVTETSDYLYDPAEQLYFRDSRYFPPREANGKKVFWSRGNG